MKTVHGFAVAMAAAMIGCASHAPIEGETPEFTVTGPVDENSALPGEPSTTDDEGLDAQQRGCVVYIRCWYSGTYSCSLPNGSNQARGRLDASEQEGSHTALRCLNYPRSANALLNRARGRAFAGLNAWMAVNERRGGTCAINLTAAGTCAGAAANR
jgi:hypothetical protein